VVEERGPTLLIDNQVLISGEVPRVTGFETGFPIHKARAGDGWEPDPLILDDQNLVVDVPGHCTGWKATHRLAAALPDAFIQPSVGTVLRF
jgi:metal-dependent hydrolase (beta-lactamase superfamily II)